MSLLRFMKHASPTANHKWGGGGGGGGGEEVHIEKYILYGEIKRYMVSFDTSCKKHPAQLW